RGRRAGRPRRAVRRRAAVRAPGALAPPRRLVGGAPAPGRHGLALGVHGGPRGAVALHRAVLPARGGPRGAPRRRRDRVRQRRPRRLGVRGPARRHDNTGDGVARAALPGPERGRDRDRDPAPAVIPRPAPAGSGSRERAASGEPPCSPARAPGVARGRRRRGALPTPAARGSGAGLPGISAGLRGPPPGPGRDALPVPGQGLGSASAGRRSIHGRAPSSWAARRKSVASSPYGPTSWTASGRPRSAPAVSTWPRGSTIAGWPVRLNQTVNGENANTRRQYSSTSSIIMSSHPSGTAPGVARAGVRRTSWSRWNAAICRPRRWAAWVART